MAGSPFPPKDKADAKSKKGKGKKFGGNLGQLMAKGEAKKQAPPFTPGRR